MAVCVCVFAQLSPTACNAMDEARQAPLSMGFPGKSTGVGCHFLLQGIFQTQGSNLSLLCCLHCRWILYLLSHWGSPFLLRSKLGVQEVQCLGRLTQLEGAGTASWLHLLPL